MTLALLGISVPLTFGSYGLGVVLFAGSILTAGLTLRAWTEPPTITSASLLADQLDRELRQAESIERAMWLTPGYAPDAPCSVVDEATSEALVWIYEVGEVIARDAPEWIREYRAARGPGLPDEFDPEDVLVHRIEDLLDTHELVVERIIRHLRQEGGA